MRGRYQSAPHWLLCSIMILSVQLFDRYLLSLGIIAVTHVCVIAVGLDFNAHLSAFLAMVGSAVEAHLECLACTLDFSRLAVA